MKRALNISLIFLSALLLLSCEKYNKNEGGWQADICFDCAEVYFSLEGGQKEINCTNNLTEWAVAFIETLPYDGNDSVSAEPITVQKTSPTAVLITVEAAESPRKWRIHFDGGVMEVGDIIVYQK